VSNLKQFVSFYCADKLYGIDIHVVNDVSPASNGIIPVPLSDGHIKGLVNIRGQVILVMDIGMILGNTSCLISPFTHIVILKTKTALTRVRGLSKDIDISLFHNKPVGFLVEIVGDVISVSSEEIETTATKYLNKENFNYINGVVRVEDQLLIILNPQKLLYHGNDINILKKVEE